MEPPRVISSTVVFLIGIILLLTISILSFQRVNQLDIEAGWINHTNLVKLNLERIRAGIYHTESVTSGLLLTGDSSSINLPKTIMSNFPALTGKLDSLTADNPLQQQNLDRLKRLVAPLGDSVSLVSKTRADLVNRESVMTQIDNQIDQMLAIEDQLLNQRTEIRNRIAALTPFYSLSLSLIAIFFLTLAYFRLRNESRMRSAANLQLERAIRELEMTNKELSSFNYIANHDLQEPLRKIIAFSKRIEEKEKDHYSETSKDYFNRITTAAARMQNLIDGLLAYTSPSDPGLTFEATDLNMLVRDVQNDLKEAIEEKSATIISQNLPKIKVIPIQCYQVLNNIIGNALKYSRPDIAPIITITGTKISGIDSGQPEADPSSIYWRINIQDNGIGFEQEQENKIFELFQRLHGKKEFAGTGIGLAICRKIMKMHEGFISAEGEPGKGSIFHLFFPEKK